MRTWSKVSESSTMRLKTICSTTVHAAQGVPPFCSACTGTPKKRTAARRRRTTRLPFIVACARKRMRNFPLLQSRTSHFVTLQNVSLSFPLQTISQELLQYDFKQRPISPQRNFTPPKGTLGRTRKCISLKQPIFFAYKYSAHLGEISSSSPFFNLSQS